MMRKSRKTPFIAAIALVSGSILLTLLLGEIGIRIVHPSASLWEYPNYIASYTRPDPNQTTKTLRYDPLLGWEPLPGSSGVLVNQPISYSRDGLRNQNAQVELPAGRPILAVGDSYTEGYGVKDDETWPAHLERDLQKRVLNGGVRGYGLDQIVLRAEKLADIFHPDTIVLGFIAHDVGRVGRSVDESAHKSYFDPTGSGLELRNVPVPTTPFMGPRAWPRRILGYSYLLDFVMRRVGANTLWYGAEVPTGADDSEVACRLMDRFAELAQRHRVRGLVVSLAQYSSWTVPGAGAKDRAVISRVLECARRRGLQTLDTYDAFAAAGATSNPDSLYAEWHFNDRGNALAAKLVAEVLRGPR